ncbi:MAG: undecaprenyl-phosphate glucose phosphotransferase [Hydrogenophilales bacterium CG18_big_fil_WC_8_21_14_2_50_58_12]|nr:MAG: undecaprenyl-phosphate glucose phosphotransferase [Hydrogenophilales bacterium CG18_big_fil_WC_8_21_14_2_50_58_12]
MTIARLDVVWDSKRILAAAFAVVLFAFHAEFLGLYRSWRSSSFIDEIQTLLKVWLLTIFLLVTLAFITKTSEIFSRLVMMLWWTFAPVSLIAIRLIVRWGLRFVRRSGANVRNIAIVGHNPVGIRLVKHLNAISWTGLVVNGFFDHRTREFGETVVGALKYSISSIDALMLKAHSGEIDSVYIALPMKAELRIAELVNQLSDTTASVYVIPDLFISELMHSRWIDFGGMPLVSVYETPFYGLYGWVKRMEDLFLGGLILLLILPIMVAIAITVKLTSPGPVIFKQRRYGLNGEEMEVWKFRSMTVCEDGDHVPQAKKCDVRITPFGAFLRKTSLDELPQFINVLQGTMSIVGPRPHAVAHNEQYRKLIRGYMLRHKVKPGITGLAQVNGWRGETDTLDKMQKRVDFDLEYIQNWSLWLDLKIVFLTVWGGFCGAHVY